MKMRIATINYTYGGDLVSISSGNEEDGNYHELKLDSSPSASVDYEIREFIKANEITHVEDREYTLKSSRGEYLCPVERYLEYLDSPR